MAIEVSRVEMGKLRDAVADIQDRAARYQEVSHVRFVESSGPAGTLGRSIEAEGSPDGEFLTFRLHVHDGKTFRTRGVESSLLPNWKGCFVVGK